ncbi:MAG: glycosyltransferase [Isosphaerales bacterium]
MRTELQYRLQYPGAYRLGLVKAGFRRMLNSKAVPIRFLIVSDGVAYASEQQFAPLRRYAGLLRSRLGVVFYYMRLSDGMRLNRAALSRFHAVGLKLNFRAREAGRIVFQFRERISGTGTSLVYFDGDDDVCVQWPEVLQSVDLYVKKGVFASDDNYLRPFIGKSNVTDYVWKVYGVPIGEIPRSGVLEPADLGKLHLGWSTALDDKHAHLFKQAKPPSPSTKDMDILCRGSLPQDWSFSLRNPVIAKLEPLRARYRIILSLPTSRVPRRQYYEELHRSRICVSPFGYGEACGRDVEAIIYGCLLIKPDMGHLRTYPHIFVPGETYIPVRWDYADLAETCAHYLERETERARIADNAYRVLADSYRTDSFVQTFAGVLKRLGLMRA